TQKAIADKRTEVEKRAVYAYKNPAGNQLEAFLGAQSVADAVDRTQMLEKVFARDRDIIERLKILRGDLADLKRQLDADKAEKARAKENADAELVRLQKAQQGADAAKAAQDRRVAEIEAEFQALQAEEQRIRDSIKKREDELASIA